MIIQLNPPIPVFVTSKNTSGLAHLMIDYGVEYDLFWVCALDDSGQCWTVNNKYIRFTKNYTLDRNDPETK